MSKNHVGSRSHSVLPGPFGIARSDMDDLFERLFAPVGGGSAATAMGTGTGWKTPMAAWEEKDQLFIEVELPGVADEHLDVTFDEGQLRITARRDEPQREGRKYLYSNRGYGETTRSIQIPDSVDPESIQAEYTAGVLRLQLSKRPEVLPKKIEVKTK